ncbi:hypothetical protein C5S29_10770 [ANME-1 cluster archaeon GoMg3.2]|nr:hypothetical protein [ANME-1 cluster archaeon GoMg3.2]
MISHHLFLLKQEVLCMKLGIFLCTCNNSIEIDFKNVNKSLKSEAEVEVVEIHDQLCQDGLEYISGRHQEIGAGWYNHSCRYRKE